MKCCWFGVHRFLCSVPMPAPFGVFRIRRHCTDCELTQVLVATQWIDRYGFDPFHLWLVFLLGVSGFCFFVCLTPVFFVVVGLLAAYCLVTWFLNRRRMTIIHVPRISPR